MIEDHATHLHRLNRRPSTIYQRTRTLHRLAEAIAPTAILDASLHQLRTFAHQPHHSDAARHATVAHLRGYYRWAVLEGLRTDDPTLRLEMPAVARRYPRPMPDHLVRFVLTESPDRLRPWYYLAAYAGLRACEIGPLRRDDIGRTQILVRVAKGGGQRIVPIPPPLAPILATLPSRGWLFPKQGTGWGDGPTTAMQVSHLANRWLRDQEIGWTLHTLRHWYGTKLYWLTKDLRVTQENLGHHSLDTTVLYTKILAEDCVAAAAQLPDLGRVA